ncbi:MAG: hypothetical protein HW383_782 [Candidatus Magasanikbacteria bacterium]|nr:hypothetical protein [Candidatus Magasanikbacteria bacterium]
MHTENLVESFIEYTKGRKTKEMYYNAFPSLFDHYFLFWADKDLPFYDDIETIRKRTDLVLGHLSGIETQLKNHGLDAEGLHDITKNPQHTSRIALIAK